MLLSCTLSDGICLQKTITNINVRRVGVKSAGHSLPHLSSLRPDYDAANPSIIPKNFFVVALSLTHLRVLCYVITYHIFRDLNTNYMYSCLLIIVIQQKLPCARTLVMVG